MATELSEEEIALLRAKTPGTRHVVHLNHAGSALPSAATLETQHGHLDLEASIGGYEAAMSASADDLAVYTSIADLIGATADEIARAEHATAAWNAGFWSVPMKPGQRILTDNAAYGANAVGFLRAMERRGVRLEVIPSDRDGQVDTTELRRRIDDDVALIALTHVPTNGGLVNPAVEVGTIAEAAGVPYLLDACQSIGQRHIDVTAIRCDLLSATGRKYLRGPRGTGFLYASNRIVGRLTPDHPDHHGADWTSPERYDLKAGARRFEHWEYNHAAWLGLGTAVDEAREIGTDRIEVSVAARADELRDQLRSAGFEVMDLGVQRSGIVTIATDGFEAAEVAEQLRQRRINVSINTPASTWFDATARSLGVMLRLSVHYLTTSDEIEVAVDALTELCASNRV